MPTERRHLLADDDVRAQATLARDGLGRHRRVDPLVVRDRDDIEVRPGLDAVEDRRDAGRAVAGEGMDVQVGATEAGRGVGHGAAPWAPGPASGASGVALASP